jgi:chromosome segregation ATPase
MTLSRFYVARFAQAFGFHRKTHRLSDAASELHLLREAETQLGALVWEKVEGIEELSVEYWNLRKFMIEKDQVSQKLKECQLRLDQAHEERATLLNQAPEIHQELLDERLRLLQVLEALANERDQIVNEAREIRRTYDGIKMKLEVLSQEADQSEEGQILVESVTTRLTELKTKFSELKQQRLDIAEKIDTEDAKLDALDKQLNEKKNARRSNASETFQVIGNGNKEISILKAENAVLSTQMHQLYTEIGRFVSLHAKSYPACAKATEDHRGLLEVMGALRNSISFNHKLAGKS